MATFDATWEIIHKTHFDPKFNGVDWPAVRDELRPKAARAATKGELDSLIQEMLDRLGQSHMEILPVDTSSPGEKPVSKHASRKSRAEHDTDETGDVGLEVRWLNQQVVVSRVEPASPAGRAGVRPGWIVRTIDGSSLSGLLPAANEGSQSRDSNVDAWAAVVHLLKGSPGTRVKMDFLNGADRSATREIVRQRQAGELAKFGNLPAFFSNLKSEKLKGENGRHVGLIRFNIWMMPIAAGFSDAMDQLRHCDGIIIDLRGNIGGMAALVMGISGHFVHEPVSIGTMKMRDTELQFYANPRKVNAAGHRVEPFGGPLAIIVDSASFSASEIFAGGMQSIRRARIFGERTAGMALPAAFDRLPNGDVLIHALGDFVTPTGVRLEGRGVIPDTEVKLSRQELIAGRDAPVLAALKWISSESTNQKKAAMSARAE